MSPSTQRLAYIDWMRGLACLFMFQTHCYDAWLDPSARQSGFFAWSQLGGTLPAPLFIFLAGISFALVTGHLREKGSAPGATARATILRGAEIFGLAFLFRAQSFIPNFHSAPWTDFFRVDVLNILGLSMILMGVLCWLVGSSASPDTPTGAASLRNILAALAVSALISLAAPPLWTTHRPRWLPWILESYVNGVHIFDVPQPWLFPIFPWAAFAFAGLAAGFVLFSDYARKRESLVLASLLGAGLLACLLSLWFDSLPVRFYAVYDFWHTSPNFFLFRCGLLLTILFLAYAWCRWGPALKGFSPVAQLGKTSLLVYWVHILFVYGGLSILPKRQCTVAQASAGLAVITASMLALSVARTRWLRRKSAA